MSRSRITGWLSPSGREFLPCDTWDHLKVMTANRDTFFAAAKLGEVKEVMNAEEIRLDCERLAEEGEHPEWHRYDMAQDDATSAAIRAIYKAGFIRVGQIGDYLHFEYAVVPDLQRLKDFAAERGKKPTFEPVQKRL